jgi:hypothetical protein
MPDSTPPIVLTFSPADEATSVSIGSNIVVTFNENIQRGSGDIVLKTTAGTTVAIYGQSSSNVTITGSTLKINPSADLNYSTGYMVEFAVGSVQDTFGNNYLGTITYNFATVAAVNTAPVATAASILTNEDTDKTGTLTATDIDSASLTYAKVASPSNGVVTVSANGIYTYTPNTNFNGTDSFTFKANDGFLDSNFATVSINIYKKLTISKNSYVAYGLDLAKVKIVGSGTPNSIVEIRENNNFIGQTTVNYDGSWELIYISDYDKHSYALSEIFTSGWRGKDQNLELSIAREMRYANSIETAILVSKMTQEANSSFSNINRIHNRAIGFNDESQNIIAIDLTTKNKSVEINGAYQVALGTKGDVIA